MPNTKETQESPKTLASTDSYRTKIQLCSQSARHRFQDFILYLHDVLGILGWIIVVLVITLLWTIGHYETKLHKQELIKMDPVYRVIPQFHNSRNTMNRNIINEQRKVESLIKQREQMMDNYFRQLQGEPIQAGSTSTQSFQGYRSDDSVTTSYRIDFDHDTLQGSYTNTMPSELQSVQTQLVDLGLNVSLQDNELKYSGPKDRLQQVVTIVK